MSDQGPTVEILKALVKAFNSHDIDRVMSFFADDCVLEMPRGPNPNGSRAAGLENVQAALSARFKGLPDVHYGEGSHYIDGNVGISKWLLTGTATTGQRVEVRGCDFYEFHDGKVTSKDSYWKIVE